MTAIPESRLFRPSLALLALLSSTALASAQEPSAPAASDLGSVVVSANRSPTELSKVGSSVTVITRADIDREKQVYVKDYLDRVAGVNFTQNGPPGTTTTLQMRGAYAAYVLVRIDGIDISDPSSSQVAAALEHLTTAEVERIEILRGSQSALYGGTAVGGVIDITTRKAEQKGVHHRAGVEYGSYNTLSGSYGLSAASERAEVNATISRTRSDGFSAADSRNGNKEADGYDNTTANISTRLRINDMLQMFGAFRYSTHDINFDNFVFGIGPKDEAPGALRNRTSGADLGTRIGADLSLLDGRFKNTLAYQYYQTFRDTVGSSSSHYEGNRNKLEYLGNVSVNNAIGLSFGADYAREQALSSAGLSGIVQNAGAFGQVSVEPLAGLTVTGALRNDAHSLFGSHPTYRLTAAYQISPQTKLRASHSTGFRPPSAFELYAPIYGNTALQPEDSVSYDAGVDQSFFNGRAKLSATVFELDTRNLIQFVYIPAQARYGYAQVPGDTRRQGVELQGKFVATDWLTLDAGYTYTDARKSDWTRLIRVPAHKITLGATLSPFDSTTLSLMGTYVTDMLDTNYAVVLPSGSSPDQRLPDYFLLDATLNYTINDHAKVYLKGKNLLDQKYQTTWGYGTAGLSVYAGLNVTY